MCMNLYFEAAVRYSADQRKQIETNVSRFIRSFADPSRDEVDSDRHLRSDVQESLLSSVVKRRADEITTTK